MDTNSPSNLALLSSRNLDDVVVGAQNSIVATPYSSGIEFDIRGIEMSAMVAQLKGRDEIFSHKAAEEIFKAIEKADFRLIEYFLKDLIDLIRKILLEAPKKLNFFEWLTKRISQVLSQLDRQKTERIRNEIHGAFLALSCLEDKTLVTKFVESLGFSMLTTWNVSTDELLDELKNMFGNVGQLESTQEFIPAGASSAIRMLQR